MKKILVISSIITSCVINANAFYLGVEQSLSNSVTNETNSVETDTSSNVTAIKIGIRRGDKKSSRMEFLYEMGAETSNLVVGKGKSVIAFTLNYNATFETLSPIEELLPYVRLGGSYVISDEEYLNTTDGEMYNYSAAGPHIGLGAYYNITDNIDVSAGYDIGYRLWQDLQYGARKVESEDQFSKLYIGTNYSF